MADNLPQGRADNHRPPRDHPPCNLTDLTWPAVAALSADTPVVFPVAALEQHGRHMPLFTDSLLLGEVVRRVAERLGDRVLFAPLHWLGNSDHHLDFPGTLLGRPAGRTSTCSTDLLENFIAHGFRRLVLVNGHGGNIVPGQQAVFEVRQRHRTRDDLLLLAATYWTARRPSRTRPTRRSSRPRWATPASGRRR